MTLTAERHAEVAAELEHIQRFLIALAEESVAGYQLHARKGSIYSRAIILAQDVSTLRNELRQQQYWSRPRK